MYYSPFHNDPLSNVDYFSDSTSSFFSPIQDFLDQGLDSLDQGLDSASQGLHDDSLGLAIHSTEFSENILGTPPTGSPPNPSPLVPKDSPAAPELQHSPPSFLQENIKTENQSLPLPSVYPPPYLRSQIPSNPQFSSNFLLSSNPIYHTNFSGRGLSQIPSQVDLLTQGASGLDRSPSGLGAQEDDWPSKKRRRVALDSTRADSVILSREELLNISSEQFENLIAQISANRELNSSEKNEVKRQRRLIKNRESAQASRQRKKFHIDELEKKVKELTQENTTLKDRVTALSLQNSQLQNEVTFLQSVVNQSGMSAIMNRGANFLSSFGKQSQLSASTGLVLLVMLFSFGLFFNNVNPIGQKLALPIIEPVPEVRIFHREEYTSASQPKEILSVLAEQKEIPVHRLESAYKRHLARSTVKANYETPSLSQVMPPISLQTGCPSSKSISQVLPKSLPWKKNTTYLLCDSIKQILPPINVDIDITTPQNCDNIPLISFLIPPDEASFPSPDLVANASEYNGNERKNGGYLEVVCQVLEVNYVGGHSTDADTGGMGDL